MADDLVLTIDASEVMGGLGDIFGDSQPLFERAVFEVANEKVANVAITRTPKKFGTLRSSQRVKEPTVPVPGVIQVEITVGGATASYAAIVHDRDDTGIRWSEAGTGRLYLAKPLFEEAPRFAQDVADRVDLNKAIN